MISRWAAALAVLAVLASYVHFGSRGTWSFARVPWQRTEGLSFTERYYAGLAEAFRRGQLHLPYEVDPRWQQVANPYDYASRAAHGLAWEMWDASLYGGRFYLYFSPVPAVVFYIPFHILARGYPPDALAAVVFAAWSFLACVLFARRALASRRTHVPFAVWVLLIGVANVLPYTLRSVRAYEVAVTAGMAMTASFACALQRWTETRAPRHAVWMGVWLALAIATRPNLAVLLLLFALVLWSARRIGAALPALVPLAIVALALGTYNQQRFGNPLELGLGYQISYGAMRPCGVGSVPEGVQFVNNLVHYVFWAPHFRSEEAPHVLLQGNVMERGVSFAGGSEAVGGVASLNPLTLLGTAIAVVLALRRGSSESGLRGALRLMGAAWLILAGLATCRWVTARYALDFMMLMTTASVVCIEEALALLAGTDVRVRLVALFVSAIAAYAIVTCALLGLQ